MVHFVSKVTPIHFIDGNNIGLICNSIVCCSILELIVLTMQA